MLTILLSSCLVWQRCAAPSMISQCMPCCQCLCDTWYCQAYACFGMPTASPRKLPEVDDQITAGACYFDYLSLYQCACRRQNISSDEQERTGTFNGLVISTSWPQRQRWRTHSLQHHRHPHLPALGHALPSMPFVLSTYLSPYTIFCSHVASAGRQVLMIFLCPPCRQ